MKPKLLVVDDDDGHRTMLEALLGKWGYATQGAANGLEAARAVQKNPFDAVLMDIRMPDMDGMAALNEIKKYNPAVPVLLMTAYSTIENAVEAIKAGAYDYLIKPLNFDMLKLTLSRAIEHTRLKTENTMLRANARRANIIGNSPAIRHMLELIETVAPSDATVLITGPSGTGKELVARSLHELGNRVGGPWVAVNCAALSENLLESELFGHEKGAFTGADKQRPGRFYQASGGTLFLDEIGEIPPHSQVKLLRALQQKEIQRVGSDETISVDVRIVAATNKNLLEEVQKGRFREDLYYRLNVVNITVPALGKRKEDVPLLAQHFLNIFSQRNKKEIKGFTPQAMDILVNYSWPGNVRELENVIERAVVLLCGAYISEKELPPSLTAQPTKSITSGENFQPDSTLESKEREFILKTLEECGGNKSETAKRLGISRKTLHSKLKAYGE